MNEANGTNAGAPTAPGGRPPLRRPRSGRVLAGVAAGIADHLGIDVAIVRLLIVVATVVTSGIGLLVYIAAIFVIPEADPGEEQAADAAATPSGTVTGEGRRDAAFWIGVSLLVVGVLWLLGGVVGPGSPWRIFPGVYLRDLLWPLVLIGFGLALWKASDRRGPATPTWGGTPSSQPGPPPQVRPGPPPPAQPGPPPEPAGPAPSADSTGVSTAWPAAPPPTGSPGDEARARDEMTTSPLSPQATTVPLPGPAGETGSGAPAGGAPDERGGYEPRRVVAGEDVTSPGAPPPDGPDASAVQWPGDEHGEGWVPPEVPRRSLLTRLTLGAALVTVGVLWLLRLADVVTIGASRIIAASLLVVGVGLLVGTWFGRGRWLIAVGGLLLPLVVAAELLRPYGVIDMPIADVRGGFGEIAVAPAHLDDLDTSYQVAAGSLVIDLSQVEIDEPRQLSLQVVAGQALVHLPPDVTADVNATVAVGELWVDGRSSAGFGVPERSQRVEHGEGSELLTIDVNVGFGEARIDMIVDTQDPPDELDDDASALPATPAPTVPASG